MVEIVRGSFRQDEYGVTFEDGRQEDVPEGETALTETLRVVCAGTIKGAFMTSRGVGYERKVKSWTSARQLSGFPIAIPSCP